MRNLLEGLVVVEDLLGVLVELLQVADRRRLSGVVGEDVLQVADQHAELRAPVAHVVHPVDPVAAKLEQPRDGVACRRVAPRAGGEASGLRAPQPRVESEDGSAEGRERGEAVRAPRR